MKSQKIKNKSIPTFETAMETWGDGLERVYDYIISIWQLPHLAKRLDIDGPFSHSEILAIYKEWLWLLARLEHPRAGIL